MKMKRVTGIGGIFFIRAESQAGIYNLENFIKRKNTLDFYPLSNFT